MARSIGFRQFAQRLRQIRDQVDRNMDRIVRETALLGDAVFVKATPVDTGRARASTFLTIGAPATEQTEPPVRGDGGASLAFAAAQAAGVAQRIDGSDDATVFITQTTPYSVFLDKGSSVQAPNGMTKPAAAAMVLFLQRNARVLRGV